MTPWDLATHGPWRGSDNADRWVHDGPDGTVHGQRAIVGGSPVIIGALLAGPGRREDGTDVPELLSAAAVTARAAAATATTAESTKRTNATQAVRDEVTRIKAKAQGSRTTTETAFLGLAYLALHEE